MRPAAITVEATVLMVVWAFTLLPALIGFTALLVSGRRRARDRRSSSAAPSIPGLGAAETADFLWLDLLFAEGLCDLGSVARYAELARLVERALARSGIETDSVPALSGVLCAICGRPWGAPPGCGLCRDQGRVAPFARRVPV